jgi:hypothetical protein
MAGLELYWLTQLDFGQPNIHVLFGKWQMAGSYF